MERHVLAVEMYEAKAGSQTLAVDSNLRLVLGCTGPGALLDHLQREPFRCGYLGCIIIVPLAGAADRSLDHRGSVGG